MKRFMTGIRKGAWGLLALCALLLLLPRTAYADVIVEPDNDFYRRHAKECAFEGWWYLANGKAGYVSLSERPGGGVAANVTNGTRLYIEFTYGQGENAWGCTGLGPGDEGVVTRRKDSFTGWIRLGELRRVYDGAAFYLDHADAMRPYTGGIEALRTGNQALLWSYPGSGEIQGKLVPPMEGLVIDECYTDADGLDWGFLSYFQGYSDLWVCLSDPDNIGLPVRVHEEAPLIEPAPAPLPASDRMWALAILLVALVMAATIVLLRRFWKRGGGERPD